MRLSKTLTAATLAAAALLALGACGSSTKTVSVGGSATQPPASSTQASTASSHSSTTATAPPAGGGTGTTTRSAKEPEFTQQEHPSQGATGAAAVLRARGFTPASLSDYHPNQALAVLIGTRMGSGDGNGQQAFFFVNGRYIGTDTLKPSAALSVAGQSDTEVTLAYPRYRVSDALCCPSGGQARVHFQLNNGKLTPLDPIPPVSSSHGFSRR